MPNINLIQEQRLAIKRLEQKTRLFFLCFAATTAISVLSWGTLLVMTERASSDEAALKQKVDRVQPIIEETDAVKAEYAKTAPRFTTLTDARKMTDKWNIVLDHLTSQTPGQTWLTAVRASQPDAKSPILINFAGMTIRQELVGEFMLRMQQCQDLEAVNLKFSQEKQVTNGSQLEFQIEASLKDTAEVKPVTAEEEGKDK
jgi:Tfp pilus assembly protein PilN